MTIKLDCFYHQPCGVLEEIPDNMVDIVVTSAPYNNSQAKRQRNKKHNMTGYEDFSDRLPQEVYEQQQIEILNACGRILKPDGSIFYVHRPVQHNHTMITPYRWIVKSQCPVYQEIIWDRKSTHRLEPAYLRPIHELVIHMYKPGGKPRVNRDRSSWSSIWDIDWSETRKIAHPAPFPKELVWRCLELCDLPPGAVVLDPYAGSGTTLVVAAEEGHHYVGYEICERYIRIARNRVRLAKAERCMFEQMQTSKGED